MKKLIIISLLCITGCSQGTSPFNGTKCIYGTLYWLSDNNIATVLVNKDGKPLTCPWSK